MLPNWYDFVSTGFEPIDTEHREISALVQLLLEALTPGASVDAPAAAKALAEKVGLHFAREEQLMRAHGFSSFARHKEAHDLFLTDAARNLRILEEQGMTAAFRGWVTGRLVSWFRFHIAANDVALGHFLATKGAGRAAPGEAKLGP